jgi:signal transduction histidine kinase
MSEAPPIPDLLLVFNALPGANLLLAPDLRIVAASDDYLAATLTERATIVGQYIFDAFPDNPQTPQAQAVPNVRASLLQVLATRQLHEMAPQHYDVPDRTQPGRFIERHWLPRHSPVLDAQGQVQYIIQSVQDITASRTAEQQLRESRAREQAARAEAEVERQRFYQALMRMPANVALLSGPDHVYTLVNPEYERLFPARTTLGRSIREVIPELEGQGFYEIFDQVYKTGESIYQTEVEAWADFAGTGELQRRYYRTSFEPIRNMQGQVTEVLNFAVDVTAQVEGRLQVEQLNQELEARVRERTSQFEAARATTERQRRQWYELFRRAPASICVFNGPEWVYEFVNPGYQAMFPGRALLGKRLLDALPELAGQPLLAVLHRVYDTGESFEASEVLVPLARTEGGPVEDIYFDLTYQARYSEAGYIDGFVTYAYDVTARVLARRERETQQLLLAQVFEQAPVGVYVMRMPNYVLEVVNEPMARILGRPVAELRGRPFFEAVPEVATQGLPALLDQVWRTRQPLALSEQPFHLAYHQPGEVGYFSYVHQPLLDAAGQMTALVCVVHEVTAQVLARQQVNNLNKELATTNQALTVSNEELHQSNAQLTRTNVDLDTFVYTASHDLKAPITNIESIVLALRDTLSSDMQQGLVSHLLDLLDNTVTRFQVTIGQLTDIARLQLAHTGPTEPVVLAPVVQAVRLDLMPAIAAAGAQLTVAVPAELVVSFSPANLRSVVYNLLSNAIKYRAPDRLAQVHVSATPTEAGIVLTVQDNGLGMSNLQQRQLFGLFQRLHTHVEGTGVGLYISKRLIENAGGTITVQSQLNEGTTFTVTLPT